MIGEQERAAAMIHALVGGLNVSLGSERRPWEAKGPQGVASQLSPASLARRGRGPVSLSDTRSAAGPAKREEPLYMLRPNGDVWVGEWELGSPWHRVCGCRWEVTSLPRGRVKRSKKRREDTRQKEGASVSVRTPRPHRKLVPEFSGLVGGTWSSGGPGLVVFTGWAAGPGCRQAREGRVFSCT